MTDSNGRIILFIDEIHTVVGAGASEGSMDAGVALSTPVQQLVWLLPGLHCNNWRLMVMQCSADEHARPMQETC